MLSGRLGYVPILRILRKHPRYLQVFKMASTVDVDTNVSSLVLGLFHNIA